MRSAARFLVALLGFALGLHGQSEGKWCLPDSEYKLVLASNVANLRWSLFAVSVGWSTGSVPADVAVGVTNASVTSLANTLSLRARYLTTCDMERSEYMRKLGQNEAFARLLFDVTSDDSFPAARIIAEKHPSLVPRDEPDRVLQRSPEARGLPELFRGAVNDTLQAIRKQPNAPSPYRTAAGLLLGDNVQEIQEREIPVIRPVEVNPAQMFYGKSAKEAAALIASGKPPDLLAALQQYYVRPAAAAPAARK